MNTKLMLIEKERVAYIEGNTTLATFLNATLEHVISLEEQLNKRDKEAEHLEETIADLRERIGGLL